MFTKRNLVKFAKDYFIMSVVAQATDVAIHTVVEETTENQEMGIRAASLVNGWMVSKALRRPTDAMIDRIADWRVNRKVEETPLPA